jgi:hypothetical protein
MKKKKQAVKLPVSNITVPRPCGTLLTGPWTGAERPAFFSQLKAPVVSSRAPAGASNKETEIPENP